MKINKLLNLNENIEENIKLELEKLDTVYSNYQNIENELCTFTENDFLSNISKDTLNEILNKYQLSTSYIRLILSFIDIAKRTLSLALDEYIKNYDKDYLNSKLDIYNYICDDLENSISKFDNSFLRFNNLKKSINTSEENEKKDIQNDYDTLDNDTLLISEKKDAVIFPYRHEEIEKLLDTGKYNNENEIIEKIYTLPLSHFNNSAMSRFNEGFKLILSKEKGSFSQAFDLGIELMFKSNLHPAIIRACKNLKELDYFLDCLDENRLSEFSLFKIKFEMFPSVIK